MRVLTLEADHGTRTVEPHIREIDYNDKLNGYYRLLGCSRIDMVKIEADGHSYDVVCDDEAMFQRSLIPTLYVNDEQIFFGNIAFVKIDDDGDSVGLGRDDILRLMRYIGKQNCELSRWIASIRHNDRGADDEERLSAG